MQLEGGIWYAGINKNISYPEEGNEACFQIEAESFWFRHRNNCIVTAVDLYSKNEVFYDIGGGNGFVSAALQETGREVIMIEPGDQGCSNARDRGIKHIICGTFPAIQLKESSVVACGFFDVIEHIEKGSELLCSLHAVIKTGGMIYITVPAYKFLWSKEDIDAGHFRRYTVKSMKSVLKNAGYKIVYSTYLFSFLPVPIFFARTLPSWLKPDSGKTDHRKQHTRKKNFLSGVTDKIMNWELERVRKQKSIPFGSSCFIVATKR